MTEGGGLGPGRPGAALARLRAAMRRWRIPLAVIGAAVLIGGLILSISRLALDWAEIDPAPAALNALVLVPLGLALASVNLKLLARAVGRKVGFGTGFAVAAMGRVAELLPLPGGAMVRGAALMRAGASLGESSMLTLVTGLMTLALSAFLSGGAMFLAGHAHSWIVLVGGLAGLVACMAWLYRRAGLRLTLWLVLLRLLVMTLAAVRLVAAFAVIGVHLSGLEAVIFILCTTLSTAATIVPAGLGVAETAAAALAFYVNISPAAAFLAVALNSTIGLAVCGVVALVAAYRFKSVPARPAAGK